MEDLKMIFEKLQGIMEENLSIERDEIKLDSTFQIQFLNPP